MGERDHSQRPIAVIGAGFSGTMAAIHLLRRTDRRRILLCERASSFARGVAYSTTEPVHLLNVRAANMSAFPDDPEHFSRWVDETHPDAESVVRTTVGTFVSRELYGNYLTSILREVICETDGAVRLRLIPDEVVSLDADRQGYRLTLAGGLTYEVAGAVLAVGNFLRGTDAPLVSSPWMSCFWDGLTSRAPVVIMGTGLTMVDVAMQLRARGFPGPIIAISRRGLLPSAHTATAPWPRPQLDDPGRRPSVARLLHKLRQEARKAHRSEVSWHSVIDSIRPITADLWRGLPGAEQRRFLRHARPWWDIHRHRMAPPVADAVQAMLADGYLDLRPGRILSLARAEDQVVLSYRPRGTSRTEEIVAQRVIDATGVVPASESQDPLLRSLMEQDLVRLDDHRLGLDVTSNLEVKDRFGRVAPGLWALGPIVRGVFWECTSVPDIRSQAVRVAARITETMRDDAGEPVPV